MTVSVAECAAACTAFPACAAFFTRASLCFLVGPGYEGNLEGAPNYDAYVRADAACVKTGELRL